MSSGAVAGLDIGGTKLAAAVADDTGQVLAARTTPTIRESTPDGIVASLVRLVEAAAGEAGIARADLVAVGISYGGPIDYQSGVALTCHHLPGWEGYPIRDRVGAALGLPALADNDANAAALGEYRFGAGRGASHLLYLTVSSGIGGGVVCSGQVYRGAHGLAGEVGHIVVVPGGPACPCGKRGCLEALASGWAIARAAERALDCSGASVLADSPRPLTAEQVCDAARCGDPLATAVLDEATEALGRAIAAAANLIDPDRVVIGGGVARAGEVFMSRVGVAFARHAAEGIAECVALVAGELDERAGAMGAVALAQARKGAD